MKLKNKKILITSGPTWVEIDQVRVLSNRATGELGRILAHKFRKEGAKVTLVEGPVSLATIKASKIKIVKFSFFEELASILKTELKKNYDAVIHAAAVSDYQLERQFSGKIQSKNKKLLLKFIPTPKLIQYIKRINPKVFLVGFKLEMDFNQRSVLRETRALFNQAKCDLVVANFYSSQGYRGFVLDQDQTLLSKVESKKQLAKVLLYLLNQRL